MKIVDLLGEFNFERFNLKRLNFARFNLARLNPTSFARLSIVKRDALLLTLVILVSYAFIISIDLAEKVTKHFAQYEDLQLDELPFLLLLMALGLAWFTYRRVRERDQEIGFAYASGTKNHAFAY